ncbi:tRNA dihydrouridine synthase DusB [Candidatus Woesearchaeota archaeon]|nr:tRNA dihydrouridine synthase DusB [Candidatus Woesearchaeota archaeon]
MTSAFPRLSSPAILSPMAGVTDVAFRALCKRYGAGLTCTEFVSGTGLVRGNAHTHRMVHTDVSETPVAVQLFGNEIKDVVDAARMFEDRFDVIDINCGCPAWKVIKTGAGSEMLRSPERIASFVNKLASSVSRPVTVKIRAGIDAKTINAVEVAKIVEDAGAAAIAVHGRTQAQGYSGRADWDIVKRVKDAVDIPVIGNGDVFTPETFKRRLDESGVDAIMLARGAVGNPFLFTQIDQYLKTGAYEMRDRLSLFDEFLDLAKEHALDFGIVKNHAIMFSKGVVGGAALRLALTRCRTSEELQRIVLV